MDRKEREIQELKAKVAELELRLSSVAGQKLTNDNSAIADLSDPYRPTKLAEQFKEAYDNEWTNAFEVLCKDKYGDDKTVHHLSDIVLKIYQFCQYVERTQVEELMGLQKYFLETLTVPKYYDPKTNKVFCYGNGNMKRKPTDEEMSMTVRVIKQYRKTLCMSSLPGVQELFFSYKLKEILPDRKEKAIKSFCDTITRLAWLMCIQDPSMFLQWQRPGDQVNTEHFNYYTRTGKIVVDTVWPAVFLHQGGPLMSKGVVSVK